MYICPNKNVIFSFLQLDDACRRGSTAADCNIGGCMLLLSIWSWEHFPIGRPVPDLATIWDDQGDPDRTATWAHRWDKVNREWGTSRSLYLQYTNEFDTLTADMVITQIIPAYMYILFPLVIYKVIFSMHR